MSRRGGRPIGLPALALIIALIVGNIALIALNLRKHDLPPFRSSADPAAREVDGEVDIGEIDVGESTDSEVAGAATRAEADVPAIEPSENTPGLAGTADFDVVLLHDPGQVAVPAAGVAALDEIADVLSQELAAGVSVVAHIDDLGDSDANAAVAFARASAVVDYLESVGVDRRRTVMAIPPANPGAPPNDSEQERRFNRRVEVKLLSGPASGTESGPGSGGAVAGRVDSADDGENDAAVVDQRWSIDGALAAGFDCPQPVVGEPFRVGYAADFSSQGMAADVPGSLAARHLARMINCSGGVEGRSLEIQVVDVSGTTLGSRPAIAELLDWQPDAIIGPAVAATGLRLREAIAGRIPLLFPMAIEPALADPTRLSFTMLPTTPGSAVAAAQFAVDQGWLRAAVIRPPGVAYHTETAVFAQAFAAAGGLVVAEADAAAGVGAALQDVVQSGSDSVAGPSGAAGGFDVVFAPMGAQAFDELQQVAGATGLDVAFLNSDPTAVYDGDAEYDARSYALSSVLADQDGRVARLDRSFAAAAGSPSSNPAVAALVGDALAVIINAHLNAGQGDAEAVSTAISQGIPVQGASGTMFYGGSGSPIRTTYVVQQFDGGVGPVARIEP